MQALSRVFECGKTLICFRFHGLCTDSGSVNCYYQSVNRKNNKQNRPYRNPARQARHCIRGVGIGQIGSHCASTYRIRHGAGSDGDFMAAWFSCSGMPQCLPVKGSSFPRTPESSGVFTERHWVPRSPLSRGRRRKGNLAGNRTCLDGITGMPGMACLPQDGRQPAVPAPRAAFRFAVVVNVKLVNQDDGNDEVRLILWISAKDRCGSTSWLL